jgi:Uma2 family endonuclease
MKKLIETATMTVEEYIAFEEKSETRHEFINGQLCETPETSDTHNEINGNLAIAFRQHLKDKTFRIYTSVKVSVIENQHYTYPDVFVTNHKLDADSRYIKRYPSVIVEVLSDGTRVYDKTDKFIRYQKIESLRHYLTVEPEKTLIECYTKQADGSWEVETFTNISETISLPALNITLSMRDIYE